MEVRKCVKAYKSLIEGHYYTTWQMGGKLVVMSYDPETKSSPFEAPIDVFSIETESLSPIACLRRDNPQEAKRVVEELMNG